MANELKDVLRVNAAEATLDATIRNKQIGMATDTFRLGANFNATLRHYSADEVAATYTAKRTIQLTTDQLRLAYSAGVYADVGVDVSNNLAVKIGATTAVTVSATGVGIGGEPDATAMLKVTGESYFTDTVGVGIAVPDCKLHVYTGDAGQTAPANSTLCLESAGANYLTMLAGNNHDCGILFGDSGNNAVGQVVYNHGSNEMLFVTNASTRMSVYGNGTGKFNSRFGIGGEPDDTAMLKVTGESYFTDIVRIGPTDSTPLTIVEEGNSCQVHLINYSNTAGAPSFVGLYHSRGTEISPTPTQSGDTLGVLGFGGRGQNALVTGAQIVGIASANWATGGDTTDNPADIVFKTAPDGGADVEEHMRITSAGNVGIGTDTPASKLTVVGEDAQVRLAHNGGNYSTIVVDSAGMAAHGNHNNQYIMRLGTNSCKVGYANGYPVDLQVDWMNQSGASDYAFKVDGTSGTTTIGQDLLVPKEYDAGAGGESPNPEDVDVDGYFAVKLTPSGSNVQYTLIGATTGQLCLVRNASSTVNATIYGIGVSSTTLNALAAMVVWYTGTGFVKIG